MRPRARTVLAAVLSPLLVAGLALVPQAAAVAEPGAAAVSFSKPVEGRLIKSDGLRVPSGSPVKLIAWAPRAVLEGVEVDAEVPSLEVGIGETTSGDGSYRIPYVETPELGEFVDEVGDINFTVEATIDGEEYVAAVVRPFGDPNALLTFFPMVDIVGIPSEVVEPPVESGVAAAAAAPILCAWHKLSTLGLRWVTVGDATTSTGATAKFTYAIGSTTTVGTAVSVKGTAGSFTASGSSTVTADVAIGFPAVTGVTGRQWRTQFVFAKFGQRCAGDPAGKYRRYLVRAVDLAGGTQSIVASIPATPAAYCTPYEAGSHFETTKAKAQTWSSGATLGSDIGINLTSQSGFNAKTKLRYDFTANRKLCGTNAIPSKAARLVSKL